MPSKARTDRLINSLIDLESLFSNGFFKSGIFMYKQKRLGFIDITQAALF